MDILTRLREIDAQISRLQRAHRDLILQFAVREPLAQEPLVPATVTLSTPIRDVGLSIRTTHCLENGGINTLSEVDQMSVDDLLALPNFGRKSLNELRDIIKEIKARQPA
jgi:DNA-directed RNA polymerase alpha subunit